MYVYIHVSPQSVYLRYEKKNWEHKKKLNTIMLRNCVISRKYPLYSVRTDRNVKIFGLLAISVLRDLPQIKSFETMAYYLEIQLALPINPSY